MPCSTVSSLAISTRSSAYFTVWIICPPMLKSPSPSRVSLARYSLYKLNRDGDKQHHCLAPLPICALPFSPLSSRTLTLWSMHNLLINLLSRQSIPLIFRICINLVPFTRSNAFCQSMKEIHSSSSSSFCYYSHHPNRIPSSFSSSKSKLIFSKYILNFPFNPLF